MKRYIASAVARVKALRAVTQEYYWTLVGSPFGRWIPAPNVLSGVVAAALITLARQAGIDWLPVGWSEAVAGAFVTYWVGPPKQLSSGALSFGSESKASITWEKGDSELYPFPDQPRIDDPKPAAQDNEGLL